MAPISVEVAGLPQVPSLLSIIWVAIFLPILCKHAWIYTEEAGKLLTPFLIVSEAIALKLRRPGSTNEYLYPQVFAGLSFIVASGCLLELWRFKQRRNPFRTWYVGPVPKINNI